MYTLFLDMLNMLNPRFQYIGIQYFLSTSFIMLTPTIYNKHTEQ